MSGVVPMVAAMLGHCAAGTAYIPALADFVPMVKGTSSMALGGRHLVKAAVGEDVTEEEMGGSAVHTKMSGCADLEVADDRECLDVVRQYLSFFPPHNQERPPVRPTGDPVDRRVEELYDIVPTAPRRAYDMRKVVHAIVDDGDVLWMKPEWAKNIVDRLGADRRPPGRRRREPADGARRRARRERGRQGRAVRLAVRRVQHPARVPARRPGFHRRLGGREAGHHPPRRQDAVRGVRGDGAEDQRRAAQELRRRLLRHERARVRGRLHRRLADGRDRGDGTRRRGQHHPPQDARSDPRGRSERRSGSSSRRRSAPTSIRTSPPATPCSTTSSIRPTRASRSGAGSSSQPTSRSTARGASTACSRSDGLRDNQPTAKVSGAGTGRSGWRRPRRTSAMGSRWSRCRCWPRPSPPIRSRSPASACSHRLAKIVVSLGGGVLVDRADRRRLMFGADVLRLAVMIGFTVLVAMRPAPPPRGRRGRARRGGSAPAG